MSDTAPDTAQASQRREAVSAHQAGRLDEALAAYTTYLARHPDDAGIWTNLGALYRASNQHEMALIAQRRAYAIAPDLAGVRGNYANILSDLGHYVQSIELRKAILKDDPANLMQHAMIGRCYRGLGQYACAVDYLAPLAPKFPEEPEIALQLAFAQLGAGQYGAGFRSYDARWKTEGVSAPTVPFPNWQDGMSVDGKSLLILPEQGFGDMILIARFIPLIAAQGAKVHLVAKPPLQRLLRGVQGIVWMDSAARPDMHIDLWVSLMDLPKLVYGPNKTGTPPPPATLIMPDDSVQRAKAITANHRHLFKVGVVWSGSATYKGNTFRSFGHREFLPLAANPKVQLFSLYKGPYLEALHKDGSAALIIDAAGSDRDFADCAATMREMDLVITSDTATAHIAGSLGIETWVALHWDAFWVYCHTGSRTAWYPSMRLFRQTTPLEWKAVFIDIATALNERVETNG